MIPNDCSTCKHYEYNRNVAHQMRCKKSGESIPVVVARSDPQKCGAMGGGWEAKSA